MTSNSELLDHESNQARVTFEEFREEWLSEFTKEDLSTVEKGQRFAYKLVTQWLGITDDDEDLILCDGSGDGGIDVAYLKRADFDGTDQEAESDEGDTWYLVQSKYGTAFQGEETVVHEGRKVISTLAGDDKRLSDPVSALLGRLGNFIDQASERDRIILVFATEQPIAESERQALYDVRSLGKDRISPAFDIEDISLRTIWEAWEPSDQPAISLPIQGSFVDPSPNIRVGTIPLNDLYRFLVAYRDKTGNLDQLYEKNVRQFLGGRGRINRGIADTLRNNPELFGLYNNGITIVVSDYDTKGDGTCILTNPFIVNGCQTTKTIWAVMQQYLDAGGTGHSEAIDQWRNRAERGAVVTKIVKSDDAHMTDITRFTNSQNAVRSQDFIALRNDFRSWQEAMANRYGVFLEIQKGGWDSQKAYQKSHPTSRQFTECASALDLLKAYAAGWLSEPGPAFRSTVLFAPGASMFKRITSEDIGFGVDALYAAFCIKKSADALKFGRGAEVLSRRVTRFLFYYVVLDFLRETLVRANNRPCTTEELTGSLISLYQSEDQEPIRGIIEAALEVISEYTNPASEDSVNKEPAFQGTLENFLKLEQLGKSEDVSPFLKSLLAAHKRIFGRSSSGQQSPRDLVTQALETSRVARARVLAR